MDKIRVDYDLVLKVQRAVEVLGGRRELGEKLGYKGKHPGNNIGLILSRRTKTISASRLKILNEILEGNFQEKLDGPEANERNGPEEEFARLDVPVFYCGSDQPCPFKTVKPYRNPQTHVSLQVQNCGKNGYCPMQFCPQTFL